LDDVYFFATLKNKEDHLLGFMMFAVTPALPFGDIKVINLLVRNPGLEKTLLSSIFSLIPQAKRIFLFVRPTNKNALQIYYALGFTQDLQPFQDPNHKIDTKYLLALEYLSTQKGEITI
jgi:ribosomal protein S18 acetylase RimI-like enzyme